jgi:cytochrome c oxidase subunit 1
MHDLAPITTQPANRGLLRRYLFSTDHKTIGLQYFFLSLAAVLVGMVLSLLMRIHIVWPKAAIPFLGQIKPENYLAYLTMHGTLMVFFVLSTAPQSGFGNYFLPLQLGASEMAFPRLNMAGFWISLLSFFVLIAAFFVPGGASLAGWTQYPPLSAIASAGPGQGRGTDLWLMSIGLFCLASVLSAINFITTTLKLRAPGMTLMRMPLTCWTWFVTAILTLLAFSVLLAAAIMLLLDRNAGTSFFVPSGLMVGGAAVDHHGGSPLLWQHLFWFFGHPEVYIAILPGMGMTSHLLSVFSRKPVFGYKAMVAATIGIGALGFSVWGHHMFVSGMSPYAGFAFSTLTTAIAVPSAVKTFNWLGTLWRGRIRFTVPLLFSVGFVSLFISGGLTGPMLAQPALDVYLHDTYFVVAHFHLIMAMAGVFAIFSATYFWFPKMFGRMMNESMARWHFWFSFIGTYAIFMPMHYLGMAGMPRRYSQMTEVTYLHGLIPLQKFITYAAFVTIAGQLIFLVNLFWSMFKGKQASDNPWEATTLEWTTATPPPHDNFGGRTPVVYNGPYEYSVPGAPRDYVMQTDPEIKPAH